MRNAIRRTLALLLCLMLCISVLPAALAAEDLEEVVDLEETVLSAEPEETSAEPVFEEDALEPLADSGTYNGLTWEVENNTVTITGFTDALPKNLTIPSKIDGRSVTKIGARALMRASIESVSLPGSLTAIEDNAFYGCKSLKELVIPDNVTSVGSGAFYGCGIKKATLSKKLTEIPASCFTHSELEEVSIPSGVQKIGAYAFNNCQSLKKVTIPGSVEMIDEWAFASCGDLTTVQLTSGLKDIGKNAFSSCWSLQTIQLPATLERIRESAFSGTGLTEITIPGKVKNIELYSFQMCNSLETVILQEGVQVMGSWAFDGCDSIKRYFLPSTFDTFDFASFLRYGPSIDVYYNGTMAKWNAVNFTVENERSYVNQCAIHCLDSKEPAEKTGVSLTLKGQIGMYFYFRAFYNADRATLTYEKNGSTTRFPIDRKTNYTSQKDEYKLLFPSIPAKEMTEKVTLRVYGKNGAKLPLIDAATGEDLGDSYSFRAVDWAYKTLNDKNSDAKLKKLAAAMLNYGKYAQIQFDYKTDDMPSAAYFPAGEMDTVVPDPANDPEIPANAGDVGWEYATLSLKGAVSANLYFSKPVTATNENGKAYPVKERDGKWIVTIENIPAKNLGDKFTVIASYGGKTATIKYSALSYINAVLSNENQPDKLKDLCKAIVLYNKYAKAYFGN